jgi:hypothetical protein
MASLGISEGTWKCISSPIYVLALINHWLFHVFDAHPILVLCITSRIGIDNSYSFLEAFDVKAGGSYGTLLFRTVRTLTGSFFLAD